MRVLIACEESATVRVAFEKEGHEAWSCDIEPSRVAGNHIQADVLSVLDDGWDLMIAHPPCTYLSKAGARWLYGSGKINQERYELGMKAKEFFLKLLNSNIPMIAVENMGFAEGNAGNPALRIWSSVFKAHLIMVEKLAATCSNKQTQ